MPTLRTVFFCTECGNESLRWQGQCPVCQAWNTLVEEPTQRTGRRGGAASSARERSTATSVVRIGDVPGAEVRRWRTNIDELDFVFGGGLVPGSIVLLGGEPGIGKSTLLLQAAARLEAANLRTLYISGEQSAAQVRMRADRLPESASTVAFLPETDVDAILEHATELRPDVLIVDSIQTVHAAGVEGAPGNVTQIRECAARLQRWAKDGGCVVLLVGHVTKEGAVAGPRTLEHLVDTVIYFEGSDTLDHRLLRATKNRFGGVDEIGVFRMTSGGLVPVENPSELFLRQRSAGSGAAVAAVMEGSRPLLVEVQALCARASYGAPQRATTGFDRQRLALLLAVLEKRVGIPFGQLDVFVNVVGGVRLKEPASDLAVAAALVSSSRDQPLPFDAVFLGEVGLGGELRLVGQVERRLIEAARQAFRIAYVPAAVAAARAPAGLEVRGLSDLSTVVGELFQLPA
jgi:DNA repair protein RadA/Sms